MFHKPLMLGFGIEKVDRTFVPTLKPLNMLGGTLFVVCFLENTLFLLFTGILTCNCINRTFLVAIYTVNTPRRPCSLFLPAENVA